MEFEYESNEPTPNIHLYINDRDFGTDWYFCGSKYLRGPKRGQNFYQLYIKDKYFMFEDDVYEHISSNEERVKLQISDIGYKQILECLNIDEDSV